MDPVALGHPLCPESFCCVTWQGLLRAELCPPPTRNSYVEVLAPSTLVCDLVYTQEFLRWN